MTVRYFFRRTGRSQNGPGGLESAPEPDWAPPDWPPPDWPPPAWPRPSGWPAPPRPVHGPLPAPPPEPLSEPLSLARSGGAALRDGPRPGLAPRDGL
ncbi:MAG TPA: hypothetical protein VF933_05540, partial [Streptosporangiaceae bacterium]